MIIETIVSTINSSSDPNFAPMGFTPISDHSGLLHPYKGSHTYANLQENGVGVVNIVDDVLLFVETALYSTVPPYDSARYVKVPLLKDANSCYEFRVVDFKKDREPGEVNVKILSRSNRRFFKGFCRASFAVLEATILATRLNYLGKAEVMKNASYFKELVRKTGGEREKQAFAMVEKYLQHAISR
ncbi:MAG: DUF447 domain-containing protein [Syntrophaceticus sp.]|jgi:hypothetical protein